MVQQWPWRWAEGRTWERGYVAERVGICREGRLVVRTGHRDAGSGGRQARAWLLVVAQRSLDGCQGRGL